MIRIDIASILLSALLLCATASTQVAPDRQPEAPIQAQATARPDASRPQLSERGPRYRLVRSDVIEVKFKFSPEYDQTVTVQPDGYITLDGASDIRIEDKTLPETTEAIRAAYQGTLHDPVITVSLKDFDKPFFIVAGRVSRPGKYELRGDTTLVEAVAIAGDFTDASKHSQVVLFRRVPGDMVEARLFDVKHMLSSRNLQEDPHLSPGDMVFVPQNRLSKIQRYLPTASMGTYLSPTQF